MADHAFRGAAGGGMTWNGGGGRVAGEHHERRIGESESRALAS